MQSAGVLSKADTLSMVDVPWQGIKVDYITKILATMGATAQFFHVSRGAGALHSSRTTATGQDVQWGLADMAAGGYMTANRLELTPFSSPYELRQFYLFVPKPVIDVTRLPGLP